MARMIEKTRGARTALFATLAIIAGALFFAGYSAYTNNTRALASILKKNGAVLPGLEEFAAENDIRSGRVVATRGTETIKIKITQQRPEESARAYQKERMALLRSIFEPQLPPYPEFLTKEASCADEYLPRERETPEGPYAILYAGERFGHGACSPDLVEYKASYGVFYCEKTSMVFEVEYFAPKETKDAVLSDFNNSFRCV